MSFWSFYKTTRLWVLMQKIKEKEERSRNRLKTQNWQGQGCMKPMPSLQPIVLINIRIQPFCTEQTNTPFTPTKYVVFN